MANRYSSQSYFVRNNTVYCAGCGANITSYYNPSKMYYACPECSNLLIHKINEVDANYLKYKPIDDDFNTSAYLCQRLKEERRKRQCEQEPDSGSFYDKIYNRDYLLAASIKAEEPLKLEFDPDTDRVVYSEGINDILRFVKGELELLPMSFYQNSKMLYDLQSDAKVLVTTAGELIQHYNENTLKVNDTYLNESAEALDKQPSDFLILQNYDKVIVCTDFIAPPKFGALCSFICKKLTVRSIDTSYVKNIRYLCNRNHCTSIEITGWDFSSVETIEDAFEANYGLTTFDLDISPADNLRSLTHSFYNMSDLTILNLHNFSCKCKLQTSFLDDCSNSLKVICNDEVFAKNLKKFVLMNATRPIKVVVQQLNDESSAEEELFGDLE